MTLIEKLNLERHLRTLHSWLGALILPWVVIAGFTGFYMNHERAVLAWFPGASLPDPASYVDAAGARAVDHAADAMAIAERLRPGAEMRMVSDSSYAGRRVLTVDTGPDTVVVDRETGFSWLRQRYWITAYKPDGSKVGTQYRWSRILSSLHTRGWVGTGLGRWLADITAIALVVFGISGLVLFWVPRHRKRKNKRARLRAAAARV